MSTGTVTSKLLLQKKLQECNRCKAAGLPNQISLQGALA
jgi:hypothetical protein